MRLSINNNRYSGSFSSESMEHFIFFPLRNPYRHYPRESLLLCLGAAFSAVLVVCFLLFVHDAVVRLPLIIISCFAVAIFAVLSVACAFVGWVNYDICQKSLNEMVDGGYIARWAYEDAEWQRFVSIEWGPKGNEHTANLRLFLKTTIFAPAFAAVASACLALGLWVHEVSIPFYHIGYWFLLFCAFFVLCRCLTYLWDRSNIQKYYRWGKEAVGETILSQHGVYFRRFFSSSESGICGMERIEEARIAPLPNSSSMSVIELDIRCLWRHKTVRIPLPAKINGKDLVWFLQSVRA
eukprot:GILJ01011354.1.p1 GENE.GILJ01011354.1~~GILJ01011354.1.p1  ORF type:complete len:295 (+),score=21.54 GILJ01011354.1:124-1008(+)